MMMFIDMNSYFASCEQQVNYYLRGRPVGVCVYTGKYGAVIAASLEAKKKGVKTGMRLNEAIQLCPELVPIETHPTRYREFHVKIMNVLRNYADEVIPKSIDEALIDLSKYKYVYKDLPALAKKIKKDIHDQVGDFIKCSIGIAPNAFLAKLATELQKPDGLVVITPENIDQHLAKLKLTDLPGIGDGMEERFLKAGIDTPLKLRHSKPEYIKAACNSIVGYYWHRRLNFEEVEIDTEINPYKTMSAMRHISGEQRKSVKTLDNILQILCMTLEKRLVKHKIRAREVYVTFKYDTNIRWKDKVRISSSIQDGMEMFNIIKSRMDKYRNHHKSEPIINNSVVSMGVVVYDFVSIDAVQYHLFEDNVRKDNLRKVMYDIKERHGAGKIQKAAEMTQETIYKDVIGFGSVKDMYYDDDIKVEYE